ncbi:MAG: hypothetical protein KAR07_08935 [Spirochaetes bacterium]|nr:hypothetical protein [Spirochaetota bacterium]
MKQQMKRVIKKTLIIILAMILTNQSFIVFGRIKLATLPERKRVEIQLDNGRYTLVEEERVVPLLKSSSRTGNNMIDFSWSNTYIDKKSIQFRPIAIRRGGRFRPIKKVTLPNGKRVEQVNVINVAYPPGENSLVWEVFSAQPCAVKVRVSYLIRNLTRSFSYRAVANKAETFLTLRNYIKVRNYSGEDFGLAGIWAGFGEKFNKIIGHQESIKILLHKFNRVPITKTYTFDWYSHGRLNADKPLASKVLMHYVLNNNKAGGLGLFPLQPGKARIFILDSRGGEAFLGEDWAGLTPIDDKMKLYLGESRDIICTRKIIFNKRYHKQGNLYNQEIIIQYEIENFKNKACKLQIVEQLNRAARQYFGKTRGDVEWRMGRKTSRQIKFNYNFGGSRPVLTINLPASSKNKKSKVVKKIVRFHFTLKNLW